MLLSSCFGGGDGGEQPALAGGTDIDPLTRFDRVVVLMFENRSFDTLLGYLYPAGSGFDGLNDGSYANPVPAYINDGHTSAMEQFYKDVANDTLPDYAFIEPRMLFNHNDMHPPGPPVVDGVKIPDPSDVRCGDLRLHQICSAVRASAIKVGDPANTLLLVTSDEHVGCYDHMAPPGGPSRQRLQPAGEMGFFFDRLGVRVPTIAISAYTAANTIVKRHVHHAAVVRTLCEKWNLPYLTERDRTAPNIRDAINLSERRDPATWPVTVPPPQPPGSSNTNPPSPQQASVPLNGLEKDFVTLAPTHFTGVEPTPDDVPKTVGATYTALLPYAGAFGSTKLVARMPSSTSVHRARTVA